MICADVVNVIREGRSPLVLTERTEHFTALAECLRPHVKNVVMLHGGRRPRETHAVSQQLAELPDDVDRVLLATGRCNGPIYVGNCRKLHLSRLSSFRGPPQEAQPYARAPAIFIRLGFDYGCRSSFRQSFSIVMMGSVPVLFGRVYEERREHHVGQRLAIAVPQKRQILHAAASLGPLDISDHGTFRPDLVSDSRRA